MASMDPVAIASVTAISRKSSGSSGPPIRSTAFAGRSSAFAAVPLAAALALAGFPVPTTQEPDLARALTEFEDALENRWSYRDANDADFDTSVAALRGRVEQGIDVADFAVELQKIIALGIDGHAEVDGFRLRSREFLPFLVEPCGDRFVAFTSDRRGFVAEGFPFLAKIDGRPLEDWLAIAREYSPRGSSQYVRRQALRTLRELGHLRQRLGLEVGAKVVVELVDESGRKKTTRELPPRDRSPTYGVWPRSESRVLDGNIGYLRLPDMDAESSVREIDEWMPKFAKTKGLVIDVRDNGGGARDALLKLYSMLASEKDSPRVINCAKYRLHRSRDEDHLSRRFMYRAEDSRWSNAEKQAIAAFAKRFEPKWEPPTDEFSDWHYLVLSRDPAVTRYAKPVAVLMNAKCFSATDIFLAGMKEIPGVTLVGEPSGGGSALVERIELGDSGLSVVLGSMASFQVDGRLFDGVGVTPDVIVDPAPEYFVGGGDRVLEEAIRRLKR